MTIVLIGTYSFQIYQRMSIVGSTESVSMMPAAIAAPLPTEERPPIEVRSRQWAWEFYYPEQDVSSTELHVPVNERAKLLLQSEDVLHGLYIPAFRVKQDIIPGRQIEFEFTPIREGRYRLRDSEHSGTYSGANQTNVVVESPEAFEKWLAFAAEQPRQPAENAAYDQYKKSEQNPISLGWESITPAPAPVVNFASSDKDPYE
jgi:cytochrome c oxidase subunit 2